MEMADLGGSVVDLLKAGGPLAVVSVVTAGGLIANSVVKVLPQLAPLVAAARGGAVTVAPSCPSDHVNDADYDTPLAALRLVAAGALVPCIGVALDGRIGVFNSAAEKLVGYGSEEILGTGIEVLMGDSDARLHNRRVSAYLTDYTAGRRPRVMGKAMPVSLRCKDGAVIAVRVDVSHINNGWAGFWCWVRPI